MDCRYGPRGSLTVYCINATTSFMKTSHYRYDHLDETLKCVNCILERINEGAFDIAGNQLRVVDIRDSGIKIIYRRAFIGLVFMERLYLSNNPINEIYPGAFSGIRKVKYLELQNAISHLKADVFRELVLLNILILSNNNLTTIEKGTFEGLSKVKTLDLSNNKLEAIDEIFEPLVNLELLKLQYNRIKKIDGNEFNPLTNLIGLFLDHNQLQKIQTFYSTPNRIRTLSLSDNNLSENTVKLGAFQHMDNLEELNLGTNAFSNIPPKFFSGLYSLRILNLFGNSILEFSTGKFSGLPHLRSLNLSQNQLESVKVSGRLALTSLHELDLSKNHIHSFEHISLIQRFPKLSHINLSNNNLSCELYIGLKTYLEKDNILIVVSDENLKHCTNSSKLTNEIIKAETSNYVGESSPSTFMITMLVLIVIIIILVGILYYTEFFVLSRI